MKNILVSALLATTMLVAPALAQDKSATPSDTQTKPMATPQSGTTMPATAGVTGGSSGMVMADAATAKIKFITANAAEVTSSKLVGKNLYNKQNENVGQIEDLVIGNSKTVTGLVVSVGGFLGLGERYVVVDPFSIFLHRTDGKLKAMVDADKDAVKNAPEYKYDKNKS